MSSVTILLIILINNIYLTITLGQCDLSSPIDLQSATYSHSLILRVQPILTSEQVFIRKVLVREVLKIGTISHHQIQMNDMIIIRLDDDVEHSCWRLLRIANIDLILFFNYTSANEFDLRYPPVESTLRVRQNIDAVLHYETYSPQVIIKTRIDKPVLSNDYSLQCNARGNPLPRLLWSKYNQMFEYYPSAKQCKTSCNIYSIQNKYQSILYFQSLTNVDSGIYICHAENAINHVMASVHLDVDQVNLINRLNINASCASLKFCHNRGQCINVDNQMKCLCDNRYFGEQCETNYDDIIKKQDNAILLFKSRFLAACFLILIAFILILIAFLSFILGRIKKTKHKQILASKPITNGSIPSIHPIEQINKSEIQQTLSSPIVQIEKNRSILTKESSTTTHDDDIIYQSKERFSLNMNKFDRFNLEPKTNHLILSEGYLEFYQPDAESGLIRPLTKRADLPKRYTKYISSNNGILLSRTVK